MIYRYIVNCGANVSPCNKLPYSLTWPTWHFPKACLKSRMCKSFIHCNCLDCPQNCHFVQLPRMCPFRASNDPSSVFFYRGKTLPQPCLFSLNFYCSFSLFYDSIQYLYFLIFAVSEDVQVSAVDIDNTETEKQTSLLEDTLSLDPVRTRS